MSTDRESPEDRTVVDDVMADVRRELVRRVAREDRERNREIYDALADE